MVEWERTSRPAHARTGGLCVNTRPYTSRRGSEGQTKMQMRNTSERKQRPARQQRGAALIATLLTIVIVSLLATGIATFLIAHHARVKVEQNSARALDMAECALNYQVQRIYANLAGTPTAYNGSNVDTAVYGLRATPIPVTGKAYNTNAGVLNAFLGLTVTNDAATTDYCLAWIEYPGDSTRGLTLTSSEDLWVYGEARVSGIVRTVRAKAGANALFSRWAVFSDSSVSVGGSFSVTPLTPDPTTGALGYIGSNGTIDIRKDGSAVGGQVVYGPATPDPDFPYVYAGRTQELPTINELADAAYLAGTYPSTANTGITRFVGTTATATNNDNQSVISSVNQATVERNNGTMTALPATGTFPSGGYGYPMKLKGKSSGANFYLNRLDGSGVTIWADVSQGPVNLWVTNTNTGNSANDQIQGNIDIVAYTTAYIDADNDGVYDAGEEATIAAGGKPVLDLENSKKFHIYYSNQNGGLTITGGGSTQNIYAMLYAYNTFSTSPYTSGSVSVGGTVTVNGAVYANSIGGNGNFEVNYPTTVSMGDGAGIFFGLRTPWQEVNPVNGN
jgi:Tfp pilus assembly protein PilX